MSLLETLVLGSYLYTTSVFVWLFRRGNKRWKRLLDNHFAHIEERLKKLEERN